MTPPGTEIFVSYFLYIVIYFTCLFVKLRYRKWTAGWRYSPVLSKVLCCHPVAVRVTAPTPEARSDQLSWGFVGAYGCSQTRHSSPSGAPSHRPEFMNHQCMFHGIHFILIKRSRLLFFHAAFPACETNWGVRNALHHVPAPYWEDGSRKQLGVMDQRVRPVANMWVSS